MPKGLKISKAEHRKIRTSPEVVEVVRNLTGSFQSIASTQAGLPREAYGTDVTVEPDRARGHVWAIWKAAQDAEAKNAVLLAQSTGSSTMHLGEK